MCSLFFFSIFWFSSLLQATISLKIMKSLSWRKHRPSCGRDICATTESYRHPPLCLHLLWKSSTESRIILTVCPHQWAFSKLSLAIPEGITKGSKKAITPQWTVIDRTMRRWNPCMKNKTFELVKVAWRQEELWRIWGYSETQFA